MYETANGSLEPRDDLHDSCLNRSTTQDGKEGIKCYNCGQKGHITTRHPSNATMFSDSANTPLHEVSRYGTIEGTSVTDVLLDLGDSRTMVRLDLV